MFEGRGCGQLTGTVLFFFFFVAADFLPCAGIFFFSTIWVVDGLETTEVATILLTGTEDGAATGVTVVVETTVTCGRVTSGVAATGSAAGG